MICCCVADYKIIPDTAPWDWYCAVDPHCCVGYNTPSADDVFPQIVTAPPNFFIALAVDVGTLNNGKLIFSCIFKALSYIIF